MAKLKEKQKEKTTKKHPKKNAQINKIKQHVIQVILL